MDTDGTINGIKPESIITLDQAQQIDGETTFSSVEVSGQLEVHGTVSGKKLDEFLPNPSLEHAKQILADCTFKELVVEGYVNVTNSLNGQNLKAVLADVVYESNSESEVVVTGSKSFNNLELQNDAVITSNYINGIAIESFMTTVDNQTVYAEKLLGVIHFENLKLAGLFDGINATELEMSSIRTFGDQFIETPLLITNHLSAKSVDIKSMLNDVSVDEYYFVDRPIEFQPQTKVGMFDLTVKNIKVNEDVVGNGKLVNFNLEELKQNRLSRSIEQNIVYPVNAEKVTVEDLFKGTMINGMDFEIFKTYMLNLKNFKADLLSGKHKLDSLIIDGNVQLKSMNDKDFETIKNNVIWLNKSNKLEGSLHFLDELEVHGALTVEKFLNGKNMTAFLENWVSKKEDPIILTSNKVVKSLMVEENMDVAEINKIPYEHLLKKQDVIDSQFLNILGTVNVDKIIVKGNFNHAKASELDNFLLYDKNTQSFTVNGDVKLLNNAQIHNLNTPHLNKLNTKAWLEDLIKINENDIQSKGKVFKGIIKSEGGANITTLNELNLQKLMDTIVVIKPDSITNINSNLYLMGDFYAELVGLKGNLTTDFIDDIDLNEWILNAFPIHKDVYLQRKSL